MSRNRGETDCAYCPGQPVVTGPFVPFAEMYPERGVYREEYRYLRLAPVECPLCEAKYAGWLNYPFHGAPQDPGEHGFVDTSFRSTFNDEPGEADYPRWKVETTYRRVPLDGSAPPEMATTATAAVLAEVAAERARQDAKWGTQDLPDGTGPEKVRSLTAIIHQHDPAGEARRLCEWATRKGRLTWAHILLEEFLEGLEEADPERLRAELVQVAAVAAAWVEAIDRRTK